MKYFLKQTMTVIAIAVFTMTVIVWGTNSILNAQTYNPINEGDIQQQVNATVSPENPKPGQTVTISLTAYGTNLNNATISWSVNGKQTQKDTGLTQFSIEAGKNGEAKRIVATIYPESGPAITKNFIISSQEVSIIYEADSYIPPLYKGKGLYNKEGTVTLVALPNLVSSSGVPLNPKNLTYKWIIDGTVQGSKSGYGRSSYVYTGSILAKDVMFEVEVTSADKSITGKGVMILSPEDPQVLSYEKNPLYGIMFNKELSSNSFFLKDKEVTVFAVPYSMSVSRAADTSLQYSWTINGGVIPVPQSQNYATLRNSSDLKGTSIIGVSLSNAGHLLQEAANSLSINF